MTPTKEPEHTRSDVWVRRVCTLVVAGVAAYASYEHQRDFALHGGADPTSAALWPLSVDGLLLLTTAALLKPRGAASRRTRVAVWLGFLLGIAVSLAANIAAAPSLSWQPIVVAGWPPVALLLSVELLAHRHRSGALAESRPEVSAESLATAERPENEKVITLAPLSQNSRPSRPPKAEDVMWDHFRHERASGRTPTGAELDRIAGTNNYGRAVLARWRRTGRLAPTPGQAERRPTLP
ncbi:DUF2637 domain-containing protein [Streptomyces sp. B6B3]|uniref:DUF2637 domain-containing protein n=1 Tax=Streptomyces sp. B6B3 TaxID=3153570 RepID=UPI00325C9967